ncbi:MAG: hypothetical protein KKD86_10245 [Bacteroidetes bacterium]|nr:hypothetical protein [Bacteroidota bacterium]MBU1679216.1 hypothetical protein [Bacteroidota bacterium]
MKSKYLLILFIIVISSLTALAQDISEMRVVGTPEFLPSELIASEKRDANGEKCAGLIIISNVSGLTFDSYNGIVETRIQPGKYFLFLSPSERTIEVFSTEHASLKIFLLDYGIQLRSGEVWQIKIAGSKSLSRADKNLFNVIFQLNQDSVYSWYGDLAPIHTNGNIIAFKIPEGTYTFNFQKKGYNTEKKEISVNKDVTESVTLSKGGSLTGTLRLPGIAVITSEPNSAEIILNRQQLGTTPYQGNL